MKTLGQIAYEDMHDSEAFTDWGKLHRQVREAWESAAKAVRAAVIEECAKELVKLAREYEMSQKQRDLYDAAEAIRSLK